MTTWVQQVSDRASAVIQSYANPRDRLVSWAAAYVELMSVHRGTAARVTADIGNSPSPAKRIYLDATERVLESTRGDGVLRSDISTLDLCRLLGGVAAVADAAELKFSERTTLLSVIIDGILQPRLSTPLKNPD